MKVFLFSSAFIISLFLYAEAQPIQTLKLRFKLSASGLPDKDNIGTTDPYVEMYYTENNGKEQKFGRTSTISDTESPNWGEIFEFDFDRSRNQKWHFKVKDHDNGREDDTVGKAWVTVQEYVDRGQQLTTNLHKKGVITISAADPSSVPSSNPQTAQTFIAQQPQVVQPIQPQPQQILIQHPQQPGVFVQQQPQVQPVPIFVQQPAQPQTIQVIQPGTVTEQPMRLRFKLSARGLPDTDLIGTIDPYVKAFYTEEGRSGETSLGRTAPIQDKENPDWTEVIEFDYYRSRKPRWHFLVLDSDDNRRDDEAGNVWVNVEEYVSKGENIVVKLPKGDLVVRKA